jgi:hypothetical protein
MQRIIPMRDFRDAKVMAQALREALAAKSVSLTHSESQELIAKVFGFRDWNVLAARIQSDAPTSHAKPDSAPKRERREIEIGITVLDRYVGFYRMGDQAVFAISRDGGQLISRLTGQRSVPIYCESRTEFFAKLVDAQISFIAGESGNVESLVLHQNGHDVVMKRIDAIEAEQVEQLVEDKITSQSPSDGTEQALRRMIESIRTGKPNYHEMSAGLAEAVRQQWSDVHPDVSEAGPIKSLRFVGVGGGGADVYFVQHENRSRYWRIRLDSQGIIVMALKSPGL